MKKVIDNPYHYAEHLKELGKKIDVSVPRNDVLPNKALTANVYSLTRFLDTSPKFGTKINNAIAALCIVEEADFREQLTLLQKTLAHTRQLLIEYIKTNNIPGCAYIIRNLTLTYDTWQNYYSKKTHDESLFKQCLILQEAIITLVDIEEHGKRLHLEFARKFGVIRNDGAIESLHVFELFSQTASTSPLLKNRECMISDKWNTLVELYKSGDHTQFIQNTGAHVINNCVQDIIQYSQKVLIPGPSIVKILRRHIFVDYDRNYKMVIITRGLDTFIIPRKGGDFDQAIVDLIFPNVIGAGILLDDILEKVHAMLGCKYCSKGDYDEGCRNRVDTAIRRFNAYVEKHTRGEIKNLIRRKKNRFKIDYIALLDLENIKS